MRSLVYEAARIEKAISEAWQKAGKPQQFQVKVLEEPERNFLGMVTRSAKVALFFQQDQSASVEKEHTASKKNTGRQKKNASEQGQKKQEAPQSEKKQQSTKKQNASESSSSQHKQNKHKHKNTASHEAGEKQHSLWTQERVQYATTWLRDVLDKMGYSDVTFTAEPQHLYLRIILSDRLITRKDQEKQLLASLASLMMTTMQRNYKKAFRGHKVVLTHP